VSKASSVMLTALTFTNLMKRCLYFSIIANLEGLYLVTSIEKK